MKKGTKVKFQFAGMTETGTVGVSYNKGTEEWLIIEGDDGKNYPINKKDLSCLTLV